MKVKTSITLPRELLETIDRHDRNRSSFIERAARAYLACLAKVRRDCMDVRIIERNADRLNSEAKDVLESALPRGVYQDAGVTTDVLSGLGESLAL